MTASASNTSTRWRSIVVDRHGNRLKTFSVFVMVVITSGDSAFFAVETAKRCGAQYFLVEQDDATDYDDPLGQVEKSIRYMQNHL